MPQEALCVHRVLGTSLGGREPDFFDFVESKAAVPSITIITITTVRTNGLGGRAWAWWQGMGLVAALLGSPRDSGTREEAHSLLS